MCKTEGQMALRFKLDSVHSVHTAVIVRFLSLKRSQRSTLCHFVGNFNADSIGEQKNAKEN